MHVDIAVVGSGFGGALLAMAARRLGRSVVLLERGRHPRFAIGESSTPLANWLLEELCDRYDLARVRPLSKWGSWQKKYPQLACGLKRGFSFFHHTPGEPFGPDREHQRQLLVAASDRDEAADTHWYRPDFDHFLVREAEAAGVSYLDETELATTAFAGDSVLLEGNRSGRSISIRARFLVDATGPRGYLHRHLALPEAEFENLPPTQALFSHFRNVRLFEEVSAASAGKRPPYPLDAAALHHVFDGGWIWVLRFNNGLTSAGVAARSSLAEPLEFAQGNRAWTKLLARLPSVAEQFAGATAEAPFVHMPRLSFRSREIAGPNWALLPSAAGFVDPLLSTGFTLTLLGVSRLAKAIEEHWGQPSFVHQLQQYSHATTQELLAAELMVAALYASMDDFPLFRAASLLYFGAVSFAEIARRLQVPGPSPSFLLYDHPQFAPQASACCRQVIALAGRGPERAKHRIKIIEDVLRAIAPIDVIGLSDPRRRSWYPVLADDLRQASGKFGLSAEEMNCRLGAQTPTQDQS